jgi:uncharacterized protein with NRDE domain
MCTASWLRDGNGYHLLFNRDEKLTRKHATRPSVSTTAGIRFLAPIDGNSGGTWIAVNEFGVTLGLLNGANLTGTETPGVHSKSRGLLILEVMAAPSADAACTLVRATDLSEFQPFTLIALDRFQPARLIEWNGSRTTFMPSANSKMPLTSSSFNTEIVRKSRRLEFDRLVGLRDNINISKLFEYHRSHGPACGAYSPCTHRADAETMSFSHIHVTPSDVRFLYAAGAPCKTLSHWSTVSIPLRQAQALERPAA